MFKVLATLDIPILVNNVGVAVSTAHFLTQDPKEIEVLLKTNIYS